MRNKHHQWKFQVSPPKLALLIVLTLALAMGGGCDFIKGFMGGDKKQASSNKVRQALKRPADKPKKAEAEEPEPEPEEPSAPKYAFSREGRTDPFLPLPGVVQITEGGPVAEISPEEVLPPLQKLELSQVKLVAVVLSGDQRKAMVQDAQGKSYIIEEGTPIGRPKVIEGERFESKVAEIRPQSITVTTARQGLRGQKIEETKPIWLRPEEGEIQ